MRREPLPWFVWFVAAPGPACARAACL